MWPTDPETLVARQVELAGRAGHEPEARLPEPPVVAGAWAGFARGLSGPGGADDPVWATAVAMRGGQVVARRAAAGRVPAAYRAGMLALRVGRVLEAVVRALPDRPDVLLVDGTARDHPRGAGLALHLGAELGVPSVGVTHRPLVAEGAWPQDVRGAVAPLWLDGERVGCWLRTRAGVRPLAVHPGWRMGLAAAVDLVLRTTGPQRTPEPLRAARHDARLARQRGAG